jgi:hypothetical protein
MGDDVFVRSVRGNAGRWYQAIKANPAAAVHINGKRIPVRAVPITDDAMIERVRDDILRTTLRLEPM